MKAPLAHAITSLCPRRWRQRYGDEFVELLQALPPSPATIADAVFLAARLRARSFTFAVLALVAVVAATNLHHAVERASPNAISFTHAAPLQRACRSYSSTSVTGYVTSRRCLD